MTGDDGPTPLTPLGWAACHGPKTTAPSCIVGRHEGQSHPHRARSQTVYHEPKRLKGFFYRARLRSTMRRGSGIRNHMAARSRMSFGKR